MSVNDIVESLSRYNLIIFLLFAIIPISSYAYGRAVSREKRGDSPYKYIYSVIIYLAAVPGMFSAVMTAYTLFIIRENLLEVNFIVYIVPLISMIITVVLVARSVDLAKIPGFDRLYGLFIVLGVTFIVALGILQTRIWLFFGSSMKVFLVIIIAFFLLLSWGSGKLFRSKEKKDEIKIDIPDIKPPE